MIKLNFNHANHVNHNNHSSDILSKLTSPASSKFRTSLKLWTFNLWMNILLFKTNRKRCTFLSQIPSFSTDSAKW